MSDVVWVVRMHDPYERTSMTVSVWTDEGSANRAAVAGSFCSVDRIRLNEDIGYD